LILAWVSGLPSGRLRTILLASAGALCSAAPVLLMLPLLGGPETRANCVLLIVSIVPVLALLAVRRHECGLGRRHFWAMAGGFAVCALMVLSWSVLRGASLRAMFQSAVLANLQQAHTWSRPLPLGYLAVAAGIAGPILAALWLTGRRGRAIQWVRLGLGSSVMILVLKVRPDQAFALALPFVWMVLLPGARTGTPLWPRSVLAAVTVLHAMNVYPVAGSQVLFTLVLLAITAAVNVHDAWSILGRDGMWSSKIMRRAEMAAVFLAFAGYVASTDVAFGAYAGKPPLDLPGTQGVHLQAEDRQKYHWIVSQVRGTCDSLVSFPAMHSVYFWTGMLPPVYPDVDGWQAYTNAERQAVERNILASPRSCVLINDTLTRFWLPAGEKTPSTLLGFIREHFVEVNRYEGLHFLVRKR